jgi:hypothetical protein
LLHSWPGGVDGEILISVRLPVVILVLKVRVVKNGAEKKMAEMVGFEPTNGFLRYTLSKRAPSTTRTHLQTSYKVE